MKRVTTREFLRNINSMTEPVQVFTRSELKGTWLPGQTAWDGAFYVSADATPEQIEHTFQSLSEQMKVIREAAQTTLPVSRPSAVSADAAQAPDDSGGSFGVSRPAPKPGSTKKKPRRPA